MAKTPYLLLSPHGIFHFRIVPTKAMREHQPDLPSEIRISLRTRDRREAVLKSHFLAYHYQSIAMGIKIKAGDYGQLIGTFRGPSGHNETVDFKPDELEAALAYAARRSGTTDSAPIIEATPESSQAIPENTPTTPQSRVSSRKPMLSALIESYRAYKPYPSWDYEQGPALRDFRELISALEHNGIYDQAGALLTAHQVRGYRERMVLTPSNAGNLKAYWTPPVDHNAVPASHKTINKKLGYVRNFLSWLHTQGHHNTDFSKILDDTHANPTAEPVGYEPFTANELKTLFESETFKNPPKPYNYWVPLLGLYTGARMDELCQLFIRDVTEYADPYLTVIPDEHKALPKPMCLHITETIDPADQPKLLAGEQKNLKNASSDRWVPIHPRLIELGFLDFVESCRKSGHPRLFPNLPYDIKNGYGRYVSRDFRKITEKLGIYAPRKKVFHSLRSNFNIALQSLGAPDELREKLMGHTPKNMNRKAYHTVQNPWDALTVLSQVDYGIQFPPYLKKNN